MTGTLKNTTGQADVKAPVRPLSLRRNRDFFLLISGQGISSIGSQVSQLAFPLLILALTHSPVQAGLMTATRSLPYALLCLPAGALVDRWNRKWVMIICDAGRAIALGSIPVAFAFHSISFAQLYLVSFIEGTLFVFFQMAETSALPHIVAKEQITTATGQNEAIYSCSLLIGPSIGGFLYSIANLLPFLGDAVSYGASVLSLFLIKAQFQEQRTATPLNLWGDVKEGL
jgi:MFS family permease